METRKSLDGVKIGIIGAGLSGLSLACLAVRKKAAVFVSDLGSRRDSAAEEMTSKGIDFEFEGHGPRLWESDMIVLSSGISPSAPAVKKAQEMGIPVLGELDFVAPYLSGRLVGVTGSNGKSTTTALTGHLIQGLGRRGVAIGNIGKPVADYAESDLEFLAIELSSFQLYWAKKLPVEVSIVTNLDPDHLDWHGSYGNYVAAKANLLKMQNPGSWAIVQERDLGFFKDFSSPYLVGLGWGADRHEKGNRIEMGEREALLWREDECRVLFHYDRLPLLGRHNLENAAMAMAAVELLGLDAEKAEPLLGSFPALPHRCEAVASIGGVDYVDDSKGTNVAASVTALGSLPGVKVVILGGQGKGEEYGPLAEAVTKHARVAIVMGTERERIVEALQQGGVERILPARDMEEAVLQAFQEARPGETVLLSPACTSWDAYPNYKERGRHFQRLVRSIQGGDGIADTQAPA